MTQTLYICYFGVREPLVQTQVIPYLLEILRDGEKGGKGEREWRVSLLTFEPVREGEKEDFDSIRDELASEGIDWQWLRYHKQPSAIATAYDVFRGALLIRRMIAKEKIDILHGRVHIPTLMGAIARTFSWRKPKLLFDIRGFFPEEYTDAGIWPEGGWLYRAAKRVERWLLKEADGFVVLTEKAREILFGEGEKGRRGEGEKRPVEVIPCCVDLEGRFSFDRETLREVKRKELNISDRFVITHLGALGGLYLTKEIADFLQVALKRNPKTFAMLLTQSDSQRIVSLLQDRGFEDKDYFVGKIAPQDVANYLVASDVGLSFVRATFATLSRSPTKIAEYLACGLPILVNSGVGDVDKLINENGVGALVDNFDREGYRAALKKIEVLGDIADRCREVAKKEFDLTNVGGARYRRIYRRLLGEE